MLERFRKNLENFGIGFHMNLKEHQPMFKKTVLFSIFLAQQKKKIFEQDCHWKWWIMRIPEKDPRQFSLTQSK